MPTFGGYATVSELSRSGLGCVYSAVETARPGDSPAGAPRHAIKTCQPDAAILGDDAAAQSVERFVEHAQTLRDIASRPECQSHWARVHDIGRMDGDAGPGAYVVVDLGTRGTIDKLAMGRVRLDAPVLSRLIREIVAGLRTLEAAMQRGHGALKPTNILLIGDTGSELTSARVVLTDPLPASQADLNRDRLADVRSIGEIIHALVLHQKFRGGWPVEGSAAWTALGPTGGKWRELVNQLLDPNDKAQRPTLQELDALLTTLGMAKRSKMPLVVGVAALVLVAGGVTTAVLVRGGGQADPAKPVLTFTRWNEDTKKRWEQLCLAFSGWYALFQSKLDEPPGEGLRDRGFKTRREAYAALDPQLKTLLELPGVGAGFDPWSIAGVKRAASARQLSGMLSDEVRSDSAVEKTERALEAIDAVRTGLIEGWEAPKKLLQTAKDFRDQFPGAPAVDNAAKFVDDIAASVQFNEATDVAAVVDKVLGVVPIVEKIGVSVESAKAAGQAVKTSGDPFLSKFGEQVTAMIATGAGAGSGRDALLALERSATQVAEAGAKLRAFVDGPWKQIEAEDFFASASYAELKNRPVTPELFTEWAVAASRHPSLNPDDDPRRGVDFAAALAALDQQRTRFVSAPLSGEIEPALDTRLRQVQADVSAIAPDRLIWRRANEQDVRTRTAAVRKELDELRVALATRIDARAAELSATASEFRTTLRARNEIVAGSDAVNSAWRSIRDDLSGFPDEQYAQTRARAKLIEDRLVKIDKSDFEPALGGADQDAVQTEWAQQLAVAASSERDRRIAGVLTLQGRAADVLGPEFDARIVAEAEAFQRWQASVRAMRSELAAAENALNAGTDPEGTQLDAAVSKWTNDEVGRQPAVASAIGGLKARVLASKALATENNVDTLLDKVRRPDPRQPELARAAWKRLGDADVGWPRTLAQAQEAKDVIASIRAVIGGLPDAQRAAAQAQVQTDLASRWQRLALAAASPRDVESALALMGDFQVDPAKIDDRLKHNLVIIEMKRDVAAQGGTDARASQMAAAFAQRIRGLGVNTPAVQAMLRGVDEIAQNKEPEKPAIDPRTLGPGSMGGRFSATFDAATSDLRFSSGGVSLDFVRVDLGPDNAVYIAARELSIGEMLAIVAGGSGAIQQIAEDSPRGADFRGPRGWAWASEAALGRAPLWIPRHPLMTTATPAYAPGIIAPGTEASVGDQAGGDPSPEHPVQSMSPVSLGVIARLAGCRFPTAAEWRAASQQFNGGGGAGANLRDQAFERQRAHVSAMRAQAGPAEDAFQWPDNGAFLPNNPPVEGEARSRADNDGVLWFTRTSVGPGGRVKNLVGNVAEFVLTDGAAMERAGATSASLSGMLERAGLAVIGGSALSDPQLPLDQPQTVSLFDSAEGLSDVGVRLAFNAAGTAPPKEPLIERLRKLVTDDALALGR